MKNQSACFLKRHKEFTSESGIPEAKNGDGGTPNKAYRKDWSAQYCCVPLCRSSSGEGQERERLGMRRLSFTHLQT